MSDLPTPPISTLCALAVSAASATKTNAASKADSLLFTSLLSFTNLLRRTRVETVVETTDCAEDNTNDNQRCPNEHYVLNARFAGVDPSPNESPNAARDDPNNPVDDSSDLKLFDEHDDETHERAQTNQQLQYLDHPPPLFGFILLRNLRLK